MRQLALFSKFGLAANGFCLVFSDVWIVKEAELELDAEQPPYALVNARLADLARLDKFEDTMRLKLAAELIHTGFNRLVKPLSRRQVLDAPRG